MPLETGTTPARPPVPPRRDEPSAAAPTPRPWCPPPLGVEMAAGDMPGDRLVLVPRHLVIAQELYPRLLSMLSTRTGKTGQHRTVIGIAGGSGSGKTGVATMLAHRLRAAGIHTLVVSGDNYPWRIPAHNDAERLGIYRLAGARALAAAGLLSAGRRSVLSDLQAANVDASPSDRHPWLAVYQKTGRAALANYLGSHRELDFLGLSAILTQFAFGAEEVWLRRTGRTLGDIWYEAADVSKTDVLILEWTHALSEHLHGVDIRVFLPSDPAATLQGRLDRGRDEGADSPFVSMVLELEQEKLARQAQCADLVPSLLMTDPDDAAEVTPCCHSTHAR